MNRQKKIPFSPPDISQSEIDQVIEVLKSGWITTGPKTRLFEDKLKDYCQTDRVLCLNSATAGLFLALKLFDIGPGDEVITSPYTYASSANVIVHCGATPVFADIQQKDFNIDPNQIAAKITPRTKAVITTDFGGFPVDYQEIHAVLESAKPLFQPT
ncbi:MAG: DegT/DnrJ/EryC1/StrS aminotransferase family protein, partial [Spirochaetes bacterium]|nr:DegT/DnrJ/EryC1/StrS aminotransferase family protein [Spirochaetota bacterium]